MLSPICKLASSISDREASNSPRGEGLRTAITGIKARAPVTAGNFASWGFLFSVGHCAIQGVRKKEDPWNSIIGASFASGALRARAGAKAIGAGALAGFIFMAVLEGVSIAIARRAAHHTRLEPPPPPQ